MALIQMHIFSEKLNMSVPVNLILPQPRSAHAPMEALPCVYLLHGMGDDASSWLRKTGVERYAAARNVAIILPDGGLSCYENMAHGGAYRDYICQELPVRMRQFFPLSADRTKNFIAGCSMGGFGALKLGLSHPEIWSRIGCFSAAHFEYRSTSPRIQAMEHRAYGEDLDGCDAQIVADIHALHAGKEKLSIWHYCGDEDFLMENALKTRTFFEELPAGALEYRFEALSGGHDWALWDEAIRRFLAALPLPKTEAMLF